MLFRASVTFDAESQEVIHMQWFKVHNVITTTSSK